MQVYSRSLVTGSDRASIFVWAVFSAMQKFSNENFDADDQTASRSLDAQADCTEHENRVFQHHHNLRVFVQLICDILFADLYPRDCTIVDWDAVYTSSGSDLFAHKLAAADAACHALLMMMDAAAWTYGVVVAADNEITSCVNFEHSSWVKSTTYRFVLQLCACSAPQL